MRAAAPAGPVYGEENLTRVRQHLELAGLDDPEKRARLASVEGLNAGKAVLSEKCVVCHDLRTVLARPRTPRDWRQTVGRMADRSTALAPITEQQQWVVTAYLIAISPELQKTVRERRQQEEQKRLSEEAAQRVTSPPDEPTTSVSTASTGPSGRALFESRCSLCHPLSVVENSPPQSRPEARELVSRMVSNGLTATEEELAAIIGYLSDTYGR